jgi:Bacterial antitoxin of type II TA system, VapB
MKTTVDVDRELADEVAQILGTTSLKDTVNGALREVVNAKLRHQLAEQILAGTLPVPTQEEYEELRRPKLPVGALEKSVLAPNRQQ